MQTRPIGSPAPRNTRGLSGTNYEEPTPEMLADLDAEASERVFAPLGITEELSGGADAMYLREIASHDLLSLAEEIALAKRMEAGHAAADLLATALATEKKEREAEDREQLEAVVEDGERARRRLIECNLRLVVSIARRYLNRGLSFLDLVQEGNIGLQIGVDRFDWRRGFRFSTYVYWWIRQAMTRSLSDHSRTIRLPIHAVELLTRVKRAEREMQTQTGKEPSVEDVAAFLGVGIERIIEARRAAQAPLSIEAPLGENSDMTRGDLIGDELASQAAHREVEAQELAEQLGSALAALDPRERTILQLRFGLNRAAERTLNEVGETLGVSRERVRQIEQSALAKLRRMPALRREMFEYLAA